MEITKQLEAIQISIYCNIISTLLKKHISLSVFKTTVFSYLVMYRYRICNKTKLYS